MKTLSYKSASVKSYAMTVALFITMSLATQSVFSQQIVGAKKITNMSQGSLIGDYELYEVADLGNGVKEYMWSVTSDLFDTGIMAHDTWHPMGGYGYLEQTSLEKVGIDAIFSEITRTDTSGYGNLYPGNHNVSISCTDEGVNPFSGLYFKVDYIRGHVYKVL